MKIFGVGDWQDGVNSSLYTHFWCSCTRTSVFVVKASGNPSQTMETWVQYLKKSYFWNFKFSNPLIFSCVLGYIYTHLDWNINNHCGLVALLSVSWAHQPEFNSWIRNQWGRDGDACQEPLVAGWGYTWRDGDACQDCVDILLVTSPCNLSQRKKTNFLVFYLLLLSET